MSDGVKEYVDSQKEIARFEEKKRKENKRAAIMGIIAGFLFMILGVANIFEEEINLVFIQTGADQSMTGLIDTYPGSGEYIARVADALDAAVKARTTDPKELAAIVDDSLNALVPDLEADAIVQAVITQINNAHKVSDTEELYHGKLKALVAGMKAACARVSSDAE
jgi:hypothetical protein